MRQADMADAGKKIGRKKKAFAIGILSGYSIRSHAKEKS